MATERFPVRILDRRSYIDTLVLKLAYAFSAQDFLTLRELARGRAIPKTKHYGEGLWSTFLTIQQPTREVIEWLLSYAEATAGRRKPWAQLSVVRVDVALDLVVDSELAAARATRYLQGHLLPVGRHRGPWKFDPEKAPETDPPRSAAERDHDPSEGERAREFRLGYLGFDIRAGVRTAVYGDKGSKIPGSGCCAHIECRILRKAALRRTGLGSIRDLLALDHRAFWTRMLRLVEPPDQVALASVMRKRMKKQGRLSEVDRTPWAYGPERMSHIFMRACADKEGRPNAHDLLLRLARARSIIGPRPQRLFRALDATRLAPNTVTNALW